jgi:flavin reductase (DIM6/NTAB) family NADH-FMN oxidoreductase RutF
MTVTRDGAGTRAIEPDWYRRVLGQYPTGVCVVAADEPGTGPCGMVVGSFTSVSLDPPLIAFYPAKSSTSWPRIEASGAFCVNILGADQEDVCRTFSAKAGNKFEKVPFHRTPQTGSPIIDGVVAWIDCDIEAVQDAGDHVLVLGRVRELDVHRPGLPLLFFQGGYGRFSPHSLAASDAGGSLTTPLRYVDLIRSLLEDLVRDLRCRCRCLAGARIGDEVIIVASAGYSRDSIDATTPMGQRLPYLPPSGSIFAAWSPDDQQEQWLRHAPASAWEHHRAALRLVQERGYSLGLLSPAPGHRAGDRRHRAHPPVRVADALDPRQGTPGRHVPPRPAERGLLSRPLQHDLPERLRRPGRQRQSGLRQVLGEGAEHLLAILELHRGGQRMQFHSECR